MQSEYSRTFEVPISPICLRHLRPQNFAHGGASGLRDDGARRNAVQRPDNKWQYENLDRFECAVANTFGPKKRKPS